MGIAPSSGTSADRWAICPMATHVFNILWQILLGVRDSGRRGIQWVVAHHPREPMKGRHGHLAHDVRRCRRSAVAVSQGIPIRITFAVDMTHAACPPLFLRRLPTPIIDDSPTRSVIELHADTVEFPDGRRD